MKNLFRFLSNHFHWLLFFGLTFFSAWLLVNNNEVQRSKYFEVSQEAAGNIHSLTGKISSYIGLKSENDYLTGRIAVLEKEIQQYRQLSETLAARLSQSDSSFSAPSSLQTSPWRFFPARVVHNQVSQTRNYLTLDRGENHGIAEGMGVLTAGGAMVGTVMSVSPNFSRVIPLLNPDSRPSCRLPSNFSGLLVWDGSDPRYSTLTDLPPQAEHQAGDTVYTTSFSAVFPDGVPVGVVADIAGKQSGFNHLKIRLLADFSSLREVLVVDYRLKTEQIELEQKTSEKGGRRR